MGGGWHHIKRQRLDFSLLSPVSVRQKQTAKDPLPTGSSPRGALWSLAIGCGFGLGRGFGWMTVGWTQHSGLCQIADSCVGFSGGRSSRAWTVTPTFTRPRSSRMWWGRHSLSWVSREMSFVSYTRKKKGVVYIASLLPHFLKGWFNQLTKETYFTTCDI